MRSYQDRLIIQLNQTVARDAVALRTISRQQAGSHVYATSLTCTDNAQMPSEEYAHYCYSNNVIRSTVSGYTHEEFITILKERVFPHILSLMTK